MVQAIAGYAIRARVVTQPLDVQKINLWLLR